MEHLEQIRLLASDFGAVLDDAQLSTLDRYLVWLGDEATRAGGIGPNETDAMLDRHLLDSLTFLIPLEDAPESLLDVGSGVGLPGIPLAVALRDTAVVLLDRSGRRCDLLRRAIRVLGLDNVTVDHRGVESWTGRVDVVVSRAALPPDRLLPHLRRVVRHTAIVGGSATSPVEVPGYTTLKIESRYLDSPRWLLIMRQS